MRSVVGDDVGEDTVDVGVEEAGATEAGAELVHQRAQLAVEGLGELVRELGARRAGAGAGPGGHDVPQVGDAADGPNVHHHDLAGIQEVQPLRAINASSRINRGKLLSSTSIATAGMALGLL
jgi:hypothetical protein